MDSVDNLTKSNLNSIFHFTHNFKKGIMPSSCCSGKVLCNAFFEPSTRTSMSFETAMLQMGGSVINFDVNTSGIKKGETFEDTLKTLQEFSDMIVLRHPEKQKIFDAIKISKIPIINGGNGDGEHPTQALLDLYTIQEYINTNKTIHICFVGDIKYSRTIHSLLKILALTEQFYEITFCCYPDCVPDLSYVNEIKRISTIKEIHVIENIDINIEKYDVFYCTRYQSERHKDCKSDFDIAPWQINQNRVNKMKQTAIILHPLPRNNEILTEVDNDRHAKYFEQVKNGVYVRMAVIYTLLFKELDNIFCTEEYNCRNQLLSEIHYW